VKQLAVAASRWSLVAAAWGCLELDSGVHSAYLRLHDILKVAYRAASFVKMAFIG
jgi:hypothetical protein